MKLELGYSDNHVYVMIYYDLGGLSALSIPIYISKSGYFLYGTIGNGLPLEKEESGPNLFLSRLKIR